MFKFNFFLFLIHIIYLILHLIVLHLIKNIYGNKIWLLIVLVHAQKIVKILFGDTESRIFSIANTTSILKIIIIIHLFQIILFILLFIKLNFNVRFINIEFLKFLF